MNPNPTSEVLRVFGAEGEATWDTIRAHFEWSSGFAWIFLTVPDGFAANVLEQDLIRLLKPQIIVNAPTATEFDIWQLPQWLKQPQAPNVLWLNLTLLETNPLLTPWRKALIDSIGRINEQRDAIRRLYQHPIVFAIAPWVKDLIRVHAPDLWSNRTLSVELTSVQDISSTRIEPQKRTFTLSITELKATYSDPEFALSEAIKIKNVPSQQDTYIRLIERAVSGYIAQSQKKAGNSQFKEALSIAEKAVVIARKESVAKGALAESLFNLGVRFHELEQREFAFEVTQEATQIYRDLARERSNAFRPALAASLTNLGSMYSDLGQQESALNVTLEAVGICRELVREKQDAFNSDLAASLINLGNMYNHLGQHEKALEATLEAVEIYRELARERPDAFNSDLAMSLNNLGIMYSDLGRQESALNVTLEAVEICRKLVQERPDTFNPDLAMSLHNLGNKYSDLGQRENALNVTLEAVEICRDLYQNFGLPFAERYAMTVNSLSRRLHEQNKIQEALEPAKLAVQVLREPFLQIPAAYAKRMEYMAKYYIDICQALNLEPDQELLKPILERLTP